MTNEMYGLQVLVSLEGINKLYVGTWEEEFFPTSLSFLTVSCRRQHVFDTIWLRLCELRTRRGYSCRLLSFLPVGGLLSSSVLRKVSPINTGLNFLFFVRGAGGGGDFFCFGEGGRAGSGSKN